MGKFSGTIDELDALDARHAAVAAPKVAPDDMGRALSYAKRDGVPPLAVAANLAEHDEADELGRVESAAKAHPALASWLSESTNVALAKDDLPALSGLALTMSRVRKLADPLQAAGAAVPRTLGITATGTAELYGVGVRALDRTLKGVFGPNLPGGNVTPEQEQVMTPAGFANLVGGKLKGAANAIDVPVDRQNLATDIGSGVGQLGTQVVQALLAPQTLVPSLLAQGADMQADRARDTGLHGTEAGDAAILGGAAVTAITEKYGVDKLLNRVPPKVKNAVMRRVADAFAGGGIEAAQEVVEGLAQDVLTKAALDNDYEIGGGIVREAQAAGGAGAIARLAVQALNGRRDRQQAHSEREALDTVVGSALESKVRTRSPEQFEDLVEKSNPEAKVFLPVESLTTLYQSEQAASAAMTDLTGSPTAWAEAVATGGEIAIPLSKYVTHLAEQHETLGAKARLQPGQDVRPDTPMPTPEEIQADIATYMAEARESDARENGPAGQVYDDIYGQLLAKMGEGGARQNASAVQAGYRRMAERLQDAGYQGDAYTLFQRFQVDVAGATSNPGPRRKGIDTDIDPILDALRDGKLPSDREVFGESLVSALVKAGGVVDRGGDLRSRGALKQRPGLISQSGMSLDDAVTWAYQEGFINAPTHAKDGAFDNDAPDMNTVLDLISGEIDGTPAYRQNATNDARSKFRDDALAMDEMLRAAGIDLSVDDNATVRAKMGVTLEQGPAVSKEAEQARAQQAADAFAVQVQAVLDGKMERRRVAKMGRTPAVLSRLGLRDLELVVPQSEIAERKHGIPSETIKAMPALLASPVAVFQSADAEHADRVVVVTEAMHNGGPVVAVIQPEASSNIGTVHFVTSFHAKTNPAAALETWVGKGLLRYVSQEKGPALWTAAGVQFPRVPTTQGRGRTVLQEEDIFKPVESENMNQDPAAGGVSASGDLNQPADGGGRRGSVSFGVPDAQGRRVFRIDLSRMDGSTFMHEMGHVWLEMLGDLASDGNAAPGIQADHDAVLRWFGIAGDTAEARRVTWAAMPIEDRRPHHEDWAEGFEHYLQTAKAPNSALRRVFAHFKVWITAAYNGIKRLDKPVSDDIRSVMERLLATDAEIAEAYSSQGHGPLLPEVVGMDLQQYSAYRTAVETARADAEASVGADVLKAQQRAQKAYNGEQRRRVYAEQLELARELPVYRALRWLRNGKLPDGEPVPMPVKLSKDDLLDQYGQSFLRHLRGTYSAEGGISPDIAAPLLGFGSGTQMVHELVNAPRLLDVVKADTDRIMAERYPDPMTDGSLPDRAMRAVHSQRQADVMLREVQALEQHTGGAVRTQAHVLKEVARQLIAEKRARDVQPHTYRQAEAKAGREAFAAASKQDWPTALAARRRQLLNTLLFTEATNARVETSKTQKFFARLKTTKARKRIGLAEGPHLDQVDALLGGFDMRVLSGPRADRQTNLREWITEQAKAGVTLNLPAWLMEETQRVPFRNLTVGQIRELRDAVKHIAHMANEANKLRLADAQWDAAEIDAEVADSILANNKSRPVDGPYVSVMSELRTAGLQVRGIQGSPADLTQQLDGFAELGPVFMHTVQVVRDAIHGEVNPRKEAASNELAAIYAKHYSRKELAGLWKAKAMMEVGGAKWNKGNILMLGLHRGNAGNVEAMLSQKKWPLTMANIEALTGTLDARDWAFVQDVAAYIDTYREAAFAATKRRTGLAPKRVEGTPFVVRTRDGKTLSLPGWYTPLAYESDGEVSPAQEMNQAYDDLRAGSNPFVNATAGSQIERTGSGGRTVKFDLGVIESHLSDVIRGTYLADAVNYAHKVMHGPKVNAAINATGHQETVKAMKLWLKDAATGELVLRAHWEKTMRAVRTNFTAAALTWKVATALLQYTGVATSLSELGPKFMQYGMRRHLLSPRKAGRYVDEASPMVKKRASNVVDSVEQLHASRVGLLRSIRSGNITWGMKMIGRTQRHVDIWTWIGAEAKGMELFGGDVKKARAYADDIVTRTQGTQEFADKNALMRGSINEGVRQTEMIRALTTLQGYMLGKGNLLYRNTARARFGEMRMDVASMGRAAKWASNMVLLLTIDAVLGAIVRGEWPDDEDEDGSVLDDWGLFIAKQTAFTLIGAFPGGSSAVSGMRGFDGQGVLSAAWSSAGDAITQANQGNADRAALKASIKVAGYITGAPSSQINKTIDAIAAKQDGQDISPYAYLVGPPKN